MSKRRFEEIPAALREGWEVTKDAKAWLELLGPHVPEDVKRLRGSRESGFLLARPRELLAADNVFEEAVRQAEESDGISPLLQVLTNVYFLASVPGEGDCLMHHSPRASETADVVVWSHEIGSFYGPVAFDLPTVSALLAAAESSASVAKRAALLRPALGRYRKDFPLTLLERTLKSAKVWKAAQPERKAKFAEPESQFEAISGRVWWIAQALRSATPDREALKQQLDWKLDGELDDYPPDVLYWLWRSFFFGEDETLETLLEQAKASASRLVRDAADYLVRERNGALAAQRQAVLAMVELMGFPARLAVGPVTFVRDDTLAELERPETERVELAEAEGDQPMNAWWGEQSLAALHPDGRRMLVSGMHDHPRKGRHPSIPNKIEALLEVDTQTGRATIFATLESGCAPTKAAYWSDDQILLLMSNGDLVLFERKAGRGVLLDSLSSSQNQALVLREHGAVVLYKSLHECPFPRGVNPPESVDVVRVEEGSLLRIANAPLALDVVALRGGELVAANASEGVGYRISGFDSAVTSGVEFLPSAFVEQELEARTGPAAVLNALAYTDCSYESASGRCLVLKATDDDPNDFEVYVGDEQGIRQANPRLVTHNEWFDFVSPERALVCTEGAAYSIDLVSGQVEKLFETPTLEVHVVAGGFAALLDGGRLVIRNPGGKEIHRLELGEGASLLGGLFEGRALAVTSQSTPLAVIAIDGEELRLVGAVRPDNPDFESASFEVLPRPMGHNRLFARIDGQLYKPFGLVAATADRSQGTKLSKRLPKAPWKQAPELTRGAIGAIAPQSP